jgi:uncharacterized small protein (DUF1192 family)
VADRRAARIGGERLMFGSQKSRRIGELTARVERLVEQRDAEKAHRIAAVTSMSTVAGHADLDARRYTAVLSRYQQRLARLAYAVVRLRRELIAAEDSRAAAERRCAALQARLDSALGLNKPGIALGASWQDRREDKPRTHSTTKGNQ